MDKNLITHGAPDETFVMGAIGAQLDVATLIDRVNSAPIAELDIREVPTADLIEAASRNEGNPSLAVSKERLEEPVLLLVLIRHGERQHWVVDGTHRLRARAAAGIPMTKLVAVKPAMVEGLLRAL